MLCSPPPPVCLTPQHTNSLPFPLAQPGMNSRLLPFMVALRVVFIPLFMLCNLQSHVYLPTIFQHDGWYIGFMILFSVSNGYLASLCMCFGPK